MGTTRQSIRLAGLLTLGLSACHDSPRENPLDPVLTPPVVLTVALDDTAGTAALTWTPYRGDQPFAEYQVLRNVSRSTVVDTLARITVQGECAHLDTTLAPDTAYEYKVAVVNTSGFEVASALLRVDGYTTRAVHLLPLAIEPDSGMVRLTWTQYRDPGYERYRVLRRQVGTDQEEELAVRLALDDTTWIDGTARHQVDYSYTIVVEAAGQSLRSLGREGRLELPAVTVQAAFDSRAATATLTWTRYRGPRFQAYQVRRRTPEEASHPVFETEQRTTTACVDSGLLGSTEYTYEVVVLTERGERIPSSPVAKAIHGLVATWPLPIEGKGAPLEQVRLYRHPGGRIAALVANRERIRLLFFTTDGDLLEERSLLDLPTPNGSPPISDARSVSLALGAGDDDLLTMSGWSRNTGLVAFSRDGALRRQEQPLTVNQTAETLIGEEAVVIGEIGLLVTDRSGTSAAKAGSEGCFAGVEVSTQGRALYTESFAGFPTSLIVHQTTAVQGWSLVPAPSCFLYTFKGWCNLVGNYSARLQRVDPGWQDFRLEAEVIPFAFSTGIAIGGADHSSFSLTLDLVSQKARLDWSFIPPPGSSSPAREAHWADPCPVVQAVPVHLSLEMAQGKVQAAVQTPVVAVWDPLAGGTAIDGGRTRPLLVNSLAMVGDAVIGTSNALPYYPTGPRQWSRGAAFPSWVSEIRARQVPGESFTRVAVCLPEIDQVRWGEVTQVAGWPHAVMRELGPRLAPAAGHLYYPLSMDLGPDGRFFVLDAGNDRILSFSSEADSRLITQWGQPGQAGGEFNFGSGAELAPAQSNAGENPIPILDFAGSICVDDEGFIYVADVYNRRIQKFAP